MEPVFRSPFAKLPIELVLLIVRDAARPTFSQCDQYNPYATTLALCRVSRDIRRAVLPELLHTVLLSEHWNLTAFEHALRMQKAYAQQDHHLHFEYAPHVRRIWIGEILKVVQQADWPHHFFIFPPSPPQIDFSLLAPVLLAAESLATNFLNLFILEGCLEHAWNSHAATNTDLAHSPLPWSIRTLTALGDISRSSWLPLESTHQGRAFLASISHVISISVSPTELHPHFRARISDYIGPRDRELPRWIMHTPWHSFTSLQSVSLALPYTKPVAPHLAPLASSGLDEQVELLTFPASLIFNHQRRALTEGREGRFPWNDRQITVSRSSKRFYVLVQNWERAWAWGLTG